MIKKLTLFIFALYLIFPNHSKSLEENGEERVSVSRAITGTGFEQILNLCAEWKEDAARKISVLQNLLTEFENFYPPKGESSLAPYEEKFGNYVKTLNILYGIGDIEAKEIYKGLYQKTQEALHEAIGDDDETIDDSMLYIFYYKNFSLLNPEIRKTLSDKYREGTAPFSKDILKSNEYAKDLGLPLTPEVFQR